MWLLPVLCAMTQITNCYTTDSYLVYSKDMAELHLHLVGSGNSECNKFPNGVEFNLTLGMTPPNEFTAVVRKFDYEKTKEVTFTGITSLADCSRAYIRVFDYGFHSDFEIFTIEQQMSNLELCFSAVVFRTRRDDVEIDFTPTGECRNIFDINENILKGASVVIDNEEFTLDTDDFFNNYAAGVLFSVVQSNIDKERLYAPFLKCFIRFVISIYNLNMKFTVDITSYDGQLVKGIITEALMGEWENKFFVKAPVDVNADIPGFMAIVGVYNEVDYRISFQHDSKVFKYVRSFEGEIDHRRAIYEFDCMKITSPAEMETCLKFYEMLNEGERFDMVLDIIFKLDTEFIVKYQETLEPVYSCWSRVVEQIGRSDFCAVMEWTKSCPDGVSGELSVTRMGSASTGIVDNVVAVSLPEVKITPSDTIICFPVDKNVWLFDTEGMYIEFKVTSKASDYYALSQTVMKGNYSPTLITAATLGGVMIVYCIYASIYGVVTTMKSIRKLKNNKRRG